MNQLNQNQVAEFSFASPSKVLGTNLRTLVCEFLSFETKLSGGAGYRNQGSPGRWYHYLYTGDRAVQKNDWALVHNGSEFGLTRIERVLPGIHDKVAKTVITVITQNDYETYLEANKGIDNYRKVFDQLDGLLQEEDRLTRYRKLAERNEQAAALLREIGVISSDDKDETKTKAENNAGMVALPEGIYRNGRNQLVDSEGKLVSEEQRYAWGGLYEHFPLLPRNPM